MKSARMSLLISLVLSQWLVACGRESDFAHEGSETVAAAAKSPTPLQRQLWSSVSKPARQVNFDAKGYQVKVWVGSVRTKTHSDGRAITPSERAFLDVIAAAEGTSMVGRTQCGTHAGYESIQGCYALSDGSGLIKLSEMSVGHPDRSVGGSYAAGRYQFLPDSFSEVARMTRGHKSPIRDFSPAAQDRAALLAIRYKRSGEQVARLGGASPYSALLKLDKMIKDSRGNFQPEHWKIFENILDALSPEWASFPVLGTSRSFYDPQPAHMAIQLWQVYKSAYKIYAAESKPASK